MGKFVEFFGEGAASLVGAGPRDDRPTWRRNTARPWASSRSTRRPSTTSRAPAAPTPRSRPSRPTSRRRACSASRAPAQIDFTKVVTLDLGTVTPSLAGPKRPQDRIELGKVKTQFTRCSASRHRKRLQPAGETADAPPRARQDGATEPKQGAASPRCSRRARSSRDDGNKQTLARPARGRAKQPAAPT